MIGVGSPSLKVDPPVGMVTPVYGGDSGVVSGGKGSSGGAVKQTRRAVSGCGVAACRVYGSGVLCSTQACGGREGRTRVCVLAYLVCSGRINT